jgi:hypothetical protein
VFCAGWQKKSDFSFHDHPRPARSLGKGLPPAALLHPAPARICLAIRQNQNHALAPNCAAHIHGCEVLGRAAGFVGAGKGYFLETLIPQYTF